MEEATSPPMSIDYVEFPMTDVAQAKKFYGDVFGWTFEDFGDAYASFDCGNLSGGFAKAGEVHRGGGPLIVLYGSDLPALQQKVTAAGGKIVRDTFDFPGGKRFHFTDPSGNSSLLSVQRADGKGRYEVDLTQSAYPGTYQAQAAKERIRAHKAPQTCKVAASNGVYL